MLTRTVAGRVFDFSHAVGSRTGPHPVGIAIGSGGAVYTITRQYEQIADVPWNKTGLYAKVGKYSIGTVPGDEELIDEFGGYGDGDGQLIWPAGIALDSRDRVYVTDEWLNRVSVYDADGGFIATWGVAGAGDGELNRPSGIAVDNDDTLYVVDSLNHRVQRFTANGGFLGAWGTLGRGDGEFDSPWGITVDREGYVYVADHKNHRVQKLTSDGRHVTTFGEHGEGRGQLNRPSGVAVDPDGDVYVCDWANSRVQVFGPDGRFVTGLLGDAQQLARWHREQVDANADVIKARRRVYTMEPEWRFALPAGLAFDSERWRLLVADTQRFRLQIYSKLKDYMEPQFNL